MKTLAIQTDVGEIMKTLTTTMLITGLCLVLFTSLSGATGLDNARATAMAGSYIGLAKGYECPSFNPANLGLQRHRQNGIQLVGLGLSISNNSFSLDDYNEYTGATLSEAEKDELLGKIPDEGLKLNVDLSATVMSIGMGNMAISFSNTSAADINLGRAPLELLLDGNTIADTLDLSNMYAESYSVASANLSWGKRIFAAGDRQLSVGATGRYLYGLWYEEVLELDGHAATLATGFEGAGSMKARTATGGSGYAVDFGATLQLNKDYTVGVTLFNFFSSMTWDKNTEEHLYEFAFDTMTIINMGDDDIINSSDSTYDVEAFTSELPSTLHAGIAKVTGSFKYAFDWEQGFRDGAGVSTSPRISGGAELRLIGFLPLRAGFGVGGKQGTTYSAGFGLDLSLINIDIAAANYNAISSSAGKGLNLAVGIGLRL